MSKVSDVGVLVRIRLARYIIAHEFLCLLLGSNHEIVDYAVGRTVLMSDSHHKDGIAYPAGNRDQQG